jgi:alkylated DNA repair protein alkB family protein 6
MTMFDGFEANHVLINEYVPGQGILPHQDGPFFYPVICNITLGSHTLLDLYQPATTTTTSTTAATDSASTTNSTTTTSTADEVKEEVSSSLGSLLLEPLSLVVIRDHMYTTMHGIAERTEDVMDDHVLNLAACTTRAKGDRLQRGTRVSLTIRYAPKVLSIYTCAITVYNNDVACRSSKCPS